MDETRDTVAHLLAEAFPALQRITGVPLFFGGPVDPDTGELVISRLWGARTASLRDLQVQSGAGLGGRVAASGRPLVLPDYYGASAISHDYDQAVAAEGIRSTFAIPVRCEGRVVGVFYGATRESSDFGGRTLTVAGAAAGKVARTLATVPAPRTPAPPESRIPPDERAAVRAELQSIVGSVRDPAVARRLDALCRRLEPEAVLPPVSTLSARELEVLAQVALGHTNAEIARRLGLVPETVKAYLRNVMRKLAVHNRAGAVHAAYSSGLLAPPDVRT